MSNIDLGARSERTHKDKSINRSDVQMLEKNNKHMDLYYDKKSAFHTQKPKNKFTVGRHYFIDDRCTRVSPLQRKTDFQT